MLYEALFRQEFAGQQILNRFHYVSAGTPASVSGSFALAYALGAIPDGTPPTFPEDTVFWNLRDCQSNTLVHTELEVKALYDDVDFYIRPFLAGTNGFIVEAGASPFLAIGITSTRVTQAIRRGQKRVAGITEGLMQANGDLTSDALTRATALADVMSENLSYDDEGNTLTFQPCVLSFEEYTTPSGRKAYKKYATLSAQLDHAAVGIFWTPKTTVRSQTSRQYGRGK